VRTLPEGLRSTYLDFVENRHRVWEARQAGLPAPWSDDPVLQGHKFTNVFRVLDYGSQFLLSMLEEDLDERETLARCFLYRHTGRPETWQFYEVLHGHYPRIEDFPELLETWKEYRGGTRRVTRNAGSAKAADSYVFDRPIFTSAYLVFPQSQVPGTDKLESIIALATRLFGPEDVTPAWLATSSPAERFRVLQRNPGVGDFMSMQILTDWGYSRFGADDENRFVVPGPGAIIGAKALFPSWKPSEVIRWARAELLTCPPVLPLPNGGERVPSLMDVQNTLCEFSKYVRFMVQEKNYTFTPAHPGAQPSPVVPSAYL